ncbi:hypothetical protein [Hymenobacter fodinae]|uniref:Uncharacterized protein n=1 Tax=Hymenobacter fodinae TaxID=2510796 RepID=A0A4Z0P8S3_9BACT|nr:hypothetical protein [Hymenobacter fodinae]TGE08763.1 hypothetical protein EU556_13840 [Hymenobacter fodinae]
MNNNTGIILASSSQTVTPTFLFASTVCEAANVSDAFQEQVDKAMANDPGLIIQEITHRTTAINMHNRAADRILLTLLIKGEIVESIDTEAA